MRVRKAAQDRRALATVLQRGSKQVEGGTGVFTEFDGVIFLRASLVAGLVCVVGALPADAIAGNGTFTVTEGARVIDARATATGDFDSDGDPDLAALADRDEDLAVALNDGAGGFGTATEYPSASDIDVEEGELVVADFDEDGDDDVAATMPADDEVGVRLGNGNGTFAARTDFAVGQQPGQLAVGDFNADDNEDLVVANDADGDLSVLLGNGNGGFARTDFAVGGGGLLGDGLAAADLNADAAEDLIVARDGTSSGTPTDAGLTVLFGTGSGGFGSATSVGTVANRRTSVGEVATGDFDEDADTDVALSDHQGDRVLVFSGNGSGGFSSPVAFSSGFNTNPSQISVGDFDSDGDDDLAVADDAFEDVLVLPGDGAGGFGAASETGLVSDAQAIAIADFNRDGVQDLTGSDGFDSRLRVAFGKGSALLGGNLLTNGGAEGAGAARTLTGAPQIPGWTREAGGSMTYLRYSTFGGFPRREDAARWEGGLNFFSGGPNSLQSSASQTVDVSGAAASIDAGLATARLAADLGGDSNSLDQMRVFAKFVGPAGDLGPAVVVGPVTAEDRENLTQLIRRTKTAPVPPGTRQVKVTIEADRVGGGTYANGYADNVKLTVNAPAPATPSTPPGGTAGGDGSGGGGTAGGGGDSGGGGANADTDSPETTKGKGPRKTIEKPKAAFNFSSDEPGSSFECQLDRKKAKPCTSPAKVKKLKDGKHKFSVTAIDAAGNRDPSPAVWKFKVE
jgi:hypothetical protein